MTLDSKFTCNYIVIHMFLFLSLSLSGICHNALAFGLKTFLQLQKTTIIINAFTGFTDSVTKDFHQHQGTSVQYWSIFINERQPMKFICRWKPEQPPRTDNINGKPG